MPVILGISGSPRKGATEYAVQEALKAAAEIPGIETRFWTVRAKKIQFCTHCDRCIREKRMCCKEDDVKELEQLVLAADGFIVGSPVYDMNITAQLATCFNRLRPIFLVHPGALRNKAAGAITLGGTRHGGQETALISLINFFLMHEMLVCGGTGGCYSGGKVWTRDGLARGAAEDEVGMGTVRGLGRAVAEATMVTALGREAWAAKKAELGLGETGPIRDHEI
ncbi:NAD(P)H dehydrogenase (quinone) [Neomoorella glycerini]|uniref:NAD(P)H dehydrogenase (Quinone) n=1 Tax=Neomoorella glycerini TaxID=55779 RepID=A0A6I5ZMT5_9FIRM|nr:flavodoxin family protein [Moorella glycerini]QGP91192.1 NAD(P)H dehydrogenase (quinone) [Moorella glycerini]